MPAGDPASLTAFARVGVLGLLVTGQHVWPDDAVPFCVLSTPLMRGCAACGRSGLDGMERLDW